MQKLKQLIKRFLTPHCHCGAEIEEMVSGVIRCKRNHETRIL